MIQKPLFIPLMRQYYEGFRTGTKGTEYRKYGPRWNERTAPAGRKVVLSLGYGRAHRLFGEIVWAFREDEMKSADFLGIYGQVAAWCMEIKLSEWGNEEELRRKSGLNERKIK